MGWANCGDDSEGRPIGYAHEATCDHPGCDKKIDRGLAYACGGMHGEGNIWDQDVGCEKYFCGKHLRMIGHGGKTISVCAECEAEWRRELPEEAAAWDNE